MQTSVCIEDFCGRDEHGMPTSFSADWFPAAQLVSFSGDWSDVPDMPAASEPTEQQVWSWARNYGAWFRA